LNAGALTQLPQKQEIGPDDSLSMIGIKRQRDLMQGELSNPPEDALFKDNYSENEESKHEPPRKRQKTSGIPFNFRLTTKNDEFLAERVIFVSQNDAEVI
jgi:hypothetical protein